MTRQQLFDFVKDEFNILPDYPFEKDFDSAVLRRKDNKKWFGILMKVPKSKFGVEEDGYFETLNVKIDPEMKYSVLQRVGIKTAYHMNKTHWISVLIEIADQEDTKFLLTTSFDLTAKKIHKKSADL